MVIKNKPDKEMLYKLYIVDDLTPIDIAKIYNCSTGTVRNWLIKCDFKCKLCECGCGGYVKSGNRFIDGHQAHVKKGVKLTDDHKKKLRGKRPQTCGENNPNWNGGKVILICDQCGREYIKFKSLINNLHFCGQKCYYEWQSENRSGENSYSWQGGISFDPYCEKFNPTKKREVRDKYNNCDYLTGIYKNICNVMKNGKVWELDVHHFDYNKMQGCDGIKWKLVPVSHKHNIMFNKNRPFWEKLILYALEYDKEYYNNEKLDIKLLLEN